MKRLIVTSQCTKCPPLKKIIKEHNIDCEIIGEEHKDFMDLITMYDLIAAPVLIVGEGDSAQLIADVEEIVDNLGL